MEPNENVKEAEVEKPDVKKKRQIIIETDGNEINLVKAEVAGKIELIAIMQLLIEHVGKQK